MPDYNGRPVCDPDKARPSIHSPFLASNEMSLSLLLLFGVFTIGLSHRNPSFYKPAGPCPSETSDDEQTSLHPALQPSGTISFIINKLSTKSIQGSVSYKPIPVSEPSISPEASPITSMEIEDAPTNHRSYFQDTVSNLKILPPIIAAVLNRLCALFWPFSPAETSA